MRRLLALTLLRWRRTWRAMLGISLLATALGWVWHSFNILDAQDDEAKAYDDGVKKFTGKWWFPWGAVERSKDIVIVAIDDKTFNQVKLHEGWRMRYGSWPYDRVIYSDAFDFIHSLGAKQIIFDSVIDEPKAEASGDLALGQTIAQRGIPFYLGFNVTVWGEELPAVSAENVWPGDAGEPPSSTPPPAEAGPSEAEEFPAEADSAEEAPELASERRARFRERLAQLYAFPVEVRGGLTLPELGSLEVMGGADAGTSARRPLRPVPAIEPLLEVSSGFGLVLEEADEDGKLRRTRFAYTDGKNTYVTLPLAAAADALGATKLVIEPGALTLGNRRIRIDRNGTASVNYKGTLLERFDTVSLADVLRYQLRPAARAEAEARFRGKFVVVGGFGLGTGDSKATPLEASVPGVVKQAATLDNLLNDGFITDAPPWLSLLFTFLVAFGSAALVLLVRNTFFDIAWPVLLWVGFFLVTGSVLVLTEVHILSALPSFAGTISSVMATTWERLFADRERDRMKELFRPYMEEDLVELLVEQRELPKLDGEQRCITAFFSDIRGFSTFSEALQADPRGLMRLLNRYLSTVTPPLRKEGACIDKYIGDAVVALFGAPVAHHDHALRACRAALQVQKVVADLRTALRAEGLPDVYTRIGLNTDDLLVGNIGSDQLLDYTAIGDGMNLAARLEGVNKVYGTLILIGENTYLQVKEQVFCREVDLVRVQGKHRATRIYELVCLRGEETPAQVHLLGLYELGLRLYREGKFSEAAGPFGEALAVDPADGPAKTMLARCEKFSKSPPSAWEGVVDLEK